MVRVQQNLSPHSKWEPFSDSWCSAPGWGSSGKGPGSTSSPHSMSKVTIITTPKAPLCHEGLTKVLALTAVGPGHGG